MSLVIQGVGGGLAATAPDLEKANQVSEKIAEYIPSTDLAVICIRAPISCLEALLSN